MEIEKFSLGQLIDLNNRIVRRIDYLHASRPELCLGVNASGARSRTRSGGIYRASRAPT